MTLDSFHRQQASDSDDIKKASQTERNKGDSKTTNLKKFYIRKFKEI